MEQDPNTHYDAKLVVLADGDLDQSDMQIFTGSDWITNPDALLNHTLLNHAQQQKKYADTEQLASEYDEKIVKAIIEGRFKLSALLLLLDSPGGSIESYMQLKKFIELVKEQGGNVIAFLKSASGLPAELFLEATDRYMIHGSEINFSLPEGTDKEFARKRMEAVKQFIINAIDDPKIAQNIEQYFVTLQRCGDDIKFGASMLSFHLEMAQEIGDGRLTADLFNFLWVFREITQIALEIDMPRVLQEHGSSKLESVVQQHEFSNEFQRRLTTFFSTWTPSETAF